MRVAATPRDGLGHAKRMMALAAALRSLGAQVSSPDLLSPNANPMIRSSAESLGVVADEADVECVIFDSYRLGLGDELRERRVGRRVVVVDDLPIRAHSCDLLVDQNAREEAIPAYRSLTPVATELLLGPKYAMLGAEYRDASRTKSPLQQRSLRVLINWGGVAHTHLTDLAMTAIDCTGGVERGWSVETIEPSSPRVSMREAWSSADLVIGAAGSSAWERVRLGVPSVVVVLAENQRAIADHLDKLDLAISVGVVSNLTLERLAVAVDVAMRRVEAGLWILPSGICDGLGAERVATAILRM